MHRTWILLLPVLPLAAAAHRTALPTVFEENRGQAPREVAFLSRAGGSRVFLTVDGAVIDAGAGRAVRIQLLGAKRSKPSGRQLLPGRSNYLIGSGQARWHTGVPNYREVRYPRVYPGIDMVWHARGETVEHDFVLAAGADPRSIRIKIGGESPEITAQGELVAGGLRMHRPRAYQDGREVACWYERRGQAIGFGLSGYDRTRPLTIDPVLDFSTLLGGSGADSSRSVAVDAAGNIYVAGTTASVDFPTTADAFQPSHSPGQCQTSAGPASPCPDLFVTKFTGDGSTLLFSTFLSGGGENSLAGMALDSSGNVYLAGFPGSSNFPKLTPLPGYPVQSSSTFVAKLSSDGSSLLYAALLPVAAPSSISGIAVDSAGAVYLTGSSLGGLPTVNAFQNAIRMPPVFKTTDSAVHWQGLMDGLPPDLVDSITVDPTNPQTLYLGMWQGLYKSTDAGNHWTTLLQGTPPQAPCPSQYLSSTSIAVDPDHPQTVYLGTLINGIYKSTDGGVTWSSTWTGASRFVRMIAIDPSNTATLYAATDLGLYKSTDAAATWNPTGLIAPPADTSPGFVTSIVIDPSTPTTLYAGTSNGVMKSLDAGATWAAMTNGFSQSTDITALVIDPVNPQVLYASTTINFPVYHTSDGGAHWTQGEWPANTGLSPYVLWLMVDPLVHTTIWAVTDDSLLVSRDSGATWSAPTTDLPYYGVQRLASGSDGAIYAIANAADNTDAFTLKLDASGTRIVYCTYLGGSGSDWGEGIAVDTAGRAYITGFTDSFDFPLANALQPHSGGLRDAFVSVLDASGSRLLWSTYFGGSQDDWASAIAVDPAGNVHFAGWTRSPDFPLQQPSQPHFAGNSANSNAFAAKIKGDGSGLIFSTYFGGSGGDSAWSVAADSAGNTYVGGDTSSKDMPTMDAVQTALAGPDNAFVAAWNGQTGALLYATYLGGSNYDYLSGIAADSAGNAYVTGSTTSPDFPRVYAFQNTLAGQDAFLAKIAPGNTGPAISVAGAANAASYGPLVSPGEIVSIFGKALAVTPATADRAPLPVQLSDARVSVNGIAAPLFYVSPLQINAQIPYEAASGTAQIQVSSTAGTAATTIQVAPAAPAIFTLNSLGTGAGAIEHGLTGELVTASNPAVQGEIISVYCTGLGAVNPPLATGAAAPIPPPQTVLPVQASIGGMAAPVMYAGLAPEFAALYQVNVQVPAGTPSGTQNLQLSVGGANSNTVTVNIR